MGPPSVQSAISFENTGDSLKGISENLVIT